MKIVKDWFECLQVIKMGRGKPKILHKMSLYLIKLEYSKTLSIKKENNGVVIMRIKLKR